MTKKLIIKKPSDHLEPEDAKVHVGFRVSPTLKVTLKQITLHTGYDYDRLLTDMVVLFVPEYNSKNKNNPIPITIE